MRELETVRSHELVPFLAAKFKVEHWNEKDESYKAVISRFYSEHGIGELLDNSFFRKDRLESVYKLGIIDRDIIAFSIQSREPFKEYKHASLDKLCLEAAEFLITPKTKKKSA